MDTLAQARRNLHDLQDKWLRCPGTKTRQRRLGQQSKAAQAALEALLTKYETEVTQWLSPHSHLDHGISRHVITNLLVELRDEIVPEIAAHGIYRRTHDRWDFGVIFEEVALESRLYGPAAGDPQITEDQVFYQTRGDRPTPSRLINKPPRPTDLITIIVGMHEGRPTLFTAFGGPLAPREPGPNSPTDCEEAVFWRDHALAK